MFNVVPFKKEHIATLVEQKINLGNKEFFLSGLGKDFESHHDSFTGIIDGKPVVCGGIKEIWPNRGIIWCVFSESSKTNFVPVFRGIRTFLSKSKFNRIEVCIPCNFEIGKRRAEMLGFKLEIPCAKKYLADGTDCTIYSMVRE